MKTADRENQNRYTSVVATRDHGTQDQNHPAQRGRLDGKKNSGRRRKVFYLTPFMERIRSWARCHERPYQRQRICLRYGLRMSNANRSPRCKTRVESDRTASRKTLRG